MPEIDSENYKVDQSEVAFDRVAGTPLKGRFDWATALFPWSVIGPAFREECREIVAGKPMPRFRSAYVRSPDAYSSVTLRGHPFSRAELELRQDIAAIVAEARR